MKSLVIYVDVEGTLINSVGNKVVPIEPVINHVCELYDHGATLYCWSSAGANYARQAAITIGLEECFKAFLPKPNVAIDDVNIEDWRRFIQIHPTKCTSKSLYDYEDELL